ncbi:2OG-Fe(II) oxygenase [Paraglaciecola aquimarina]|uniref:2OG-Fe(II) oxygenase n=1 Tax=Paraglaciecola aquimarina TaxID=1235557 RepID=A0ABU3SVL1_9ALTE|nr:2OG-Fe(II) oxygenase [Paraglaciecola aquimarina]MDU0354059.1 2OG-Fe(II) oxygenase [Paraglaciecola aquimarina]
MNLNHQLLSETLIDAIADNLSAKGYVLLEDFLVDDLATSLQAEALSLSTQTFKTAGIGRQNNQQINGKIRTDSTLWLEGSSDCQQRYLDLMEQLRIGLNRRLFLGLFDFECHYSHYKKGDFYKTHLDAFKGQSNRILSTVFYLNHQWQANDGGELVLYSAEQHSELEVVTPTFNRCILFLSERFPHEVQVSNRDRLSIAGWFRINRS